MKIYSVLTASLTTSPVDDGDELNDLRMFPRKDIGFKKKVYESLKKESQSGSFLLGGTSEKTIRTMTNLISSLVV